MKNCNKWLSALMLVSVLMLSAIGVSAQILPNTEPKDGGYGMEMPTDDVLPHDGNLPDKTEEMMPRVDNGVIHDGAAKDGRVRDGENIVEEVTDSGISGTVWGVIIAVGIAALAVLFIFLLMPREKEKSGDRRRD